MPLPAKRWLELWQRLGVPRGTDDVLAGEFAALSQRYAEMHRHYHTAQHIAECLALLDETRGLCEHADEVELALWFHDAIYEPRAKDNEAQSAAWAERVMLAADLPHESAQRVHALILKTCHDAQAQTRDEAVLIDIDLAILGADTPRFDEYESQVRAEYAWVPDFLFNRTRRKILGEFLARPSLYTTPYVNSAREKKARENLARSLSRLA